LPVSIQAASARRLLLGDQHQPGRLAAASPCRQVGVRRRGPCHHLDLTPQLRRDEPTSQPGGRPRTPSQVGPPPWRPAMPHRAHGFGIEDRRPYGDGVITGFGTVDGRQVCVFSQDATVFGGSLGEVYGEKIVKVLDLAMKNGCPVVGINEGGGARIQEGVVSLGLYGEIFYRTVHASGVIPQISLIMGAAAGGHVYSPAVTDFISLVEQAPQQ